MMLNNSYFFGFDDGFWRESKFLLSVFQNIIKQSLDLIMRGKKQKSHEII